MCLVTAISPTLTHPVRINKVPFVRQALWPALGTSKDDRALSSECPSIQNVCVCLLKFRPHKTAEPGSNP